jgi:beta-lactamase superfamily II metal-dependent hydrolase
VLTPLRLDRRRFLQTLLCASTTLLIPASAFADNLVGSSLPPWREGNFDIHHIDTARGNSTLLVFPDGTTMLIDAGSVLSAPVGTLNPARPNASKRPGEWIAAYILAHAPRFSGEPPRLDYFLATHLHGDHIDGLADVAAHLSIGTCIDRAFPRYAANQQPPAGTSAKLYLDFLHARVSAGKPVEAAAVGSTRQIVLRKHPTASTKFNGRILSANGNVWNPATSSVDAYLANLPVAGNAHGYENNLSVATRFDYGTFSYFTGGDLDCDTFDGRMPELDIETLVVRACGRVEVAVADHHGYFDACGPNFVQALNAQAYIIPSWDIGHPGSAQMQRMEGAWDLNDSKAVHDVFALELLPQNALNNRRFSGQLKSQLGHVVVRVAPGGDTYQIYVLDSSQETSPITGVIGPYTCRA